MNYLLYGLENGKIQKEIQKIIQDIPGTCDVIPYNLANTSLNEVLQEVMTPPFFEEHKVVIAQACQFLSGNATGEVDTQSLMHYLNHPVLENTLILVGNFEKYDSRKKIVKTIQQTCRVLEFKPLKEKDKRVYVIQRCKEMGISLNERLLSCVVERLPMDTSVIDHQLEKLALYPNPLDETIIASLLIRPLEDDVFLFIESLLKGRAKKVFRLYRDMISLSYDPIYLIAVCSSQFRFYYQVKYLMMQGRSEEGIAKELKAHPYRVQLSKNMVSNVSIQTLTSILASLADCDQKIKSGQCEKNLAFELFLIHTLEELK